MHPPPELRCLGEREVLGDFSCGHDSLDRFVRQYAKQHRRRRLSVTHLAVDGTTVLGFVTTTPSELPAERAADLLPRAGRFAVPVLLLARMGTDPRAKASGRRVGEFLLREGVFRRALALADDFGCAGILTDAKAPSVGFYGRYGFVHVGPPSVDATPVSTAMFLPLETLRAALQRPDSPG